MVSPTPFRAAAQFKSAYGPNYQYQPNLHGMGAKQAFRLGAKSAAFGGAAGVGLMLFVSGIPRVRSDILQYVPVIGGYFVKPEVDPADNPF